MKPHVRYGHTPHSSAGSGAAGRGHQYRRPGGGAGGGEDGTDGAMIEEYKLEEQLAPFYETASPSERNDRAASVRCFLPPASPASSVKPALRTISIMETLSELTNARDGGGAASNRRRPPGPEEAPTKGSKTGLANPSTVAAAANIQRRKKLADNNNGVASLLDIPQWYPPKRPARPETAATGSTSDRVWDVSRLGSKLGLNSSSNNRSKARSVQDILTSPTHMPTSSSTTTGVSSATSAHGYGSLERRRRRRPGTRAGFAMSARRGETDWEREEDEEEEDGVGGGGGGGETESVYPMQSVPALFQRGRKANDQEVERERARQNYKPPTEWFKKKRPQPPQPIKVGVSELNKERGQTPDWIHKIFHVARRGHLLKLVIKNKTKPTYIYFYIF